MNLNLAKKILRRDRAKISLQKILLGFLLSIFADPRGPGQNQAEPLFFPLEPAHPAREQGGGPPACWGGAACWPPRWGCPASPAACWPPRWGCPASPAAPPTHRWAGCSGAKQPHPLCCSHPICCLPHTCVGATGWGASGAGGVGNPYSPAAPR